MSLQDIKKRLAQATPGKWHASNDNALEDWAVYPQKCGSPLPRTKANCEFIAHAPDDIAKLIKVAEAVIEFGDTSKHQHYIADGIKAGKTQYLEAWKKVREAVEDL